ncbi:uncharacterized protein LOC142977774 [Anticarsia gemmatalis]|uniref:uncharacterized protein LOC142977774 n=1 Tax=Anticarsia gemmatalis TaxID=129554 RepID=UPI003F75D690
MESDSSSAPGGGARRKRHRTSPILGSGPSGSETETECPRGPVARRGKTSSGASSSRGGVSSRGVMAPPDPVFDPEEGMESSASESPYRMDAEQLRAQAGQSAAAIYEVVRKSGHLQGGCQRTLKLAAAGLLDIVEALADRTVSDEVRRTRVESARIRRENDVLRAERKALLRELEQAKAPPATRVTCPPPAPVASDSTPTVAELLEELRRSLIASVGTMLDARFEGIEGRLLPEARVRPPLRADRMSAGSPATPTPVLTPAPTSDVVGPLPTSRAGKRGKKKGVSHPPVVELPAVAPTPRAAEAPPEAGPSGSASTWSEVVRKGKGKGKKTPPNATAQAPASQAAKKPQPARPRLTVPKSAAVVVTLHSEAAAKGVTYAQAMERAEEAVNPMDLGIESVHFRRSATGARIIEIPGSQGQEKACALAEKLKAALDGVAVIAVPVKCADLRLTGLGDTATVGKVAIAVSHAGGCLLGQVKVHPIIPGPDGMGSCIVECPVTAAKAISEAGRLLVGWTSAVVRLLEQRPLRCYRCMAVGHTRPTCPSTVDRSKVCYRCGEEGHKTAACESAAMRCSVCAAAGKPAGHLMGGRFCSPPMVKGRSGVGAWTSSTATTRPAGVTREASMSE